MSFDLYVWGSPKPVTAARARRISRQLAEEQAEVVAADPQVDGFYRQLMTWFPPLESLSEGDEQTPWSTTPMLDPGYVIMSVQWPRAEEFARRVVPLAGEYGLVCFNPQNGHVHNPPQRTPGAGLRLQLADGSVVDDPDPADLASLLQQISDKNWYAWLEQEEGWFVQVGTGPRAGGVPAGQFALEYREGSAERHYRTLVTSLADVVTAFEAFASADQSWKNAHAWSQLSR
jgi:hypothetical protein